MRKRLRRERSICTCKSPPQSDSDTSSSFNWYEEDLWTEIAKYLDGKSLIKLATTCRWFHDVIMHDSVWRFACLRDLQVPSPPSVDFEWVKLYASLADGSHSYTFRDMDKHIDWMRIGAFFFESQAAVLTQRLSLPFTILKQDNTVQGLESFGACVLNNIKSGIWIADLQLVRCPVCQLDTCEGTMQTLDARHIELFQCEGYRNGSWEYELIGSCKTEKHVDAASGGIIDLKRLKDRATTGVFNLNLWAGKANDFQPKAMITFHAVAINTNLQANQGLLTKYYIMRAGIEGEVVSLRISHQLL